MTYKHIIVIGTSAGGIHALEKLITPLPAGFNAPILIVLHISATSISYLPDIINRYSQLPAIHPANDEEIVASNIYIAPPDVHMLIKNHRIQLTRTPKINYCRPAIDPLFNSAAVCGRSVIGVLLTGMLTDGTTGLLSIKKSGGTTIIQDLNEAEFKDMPQNAFDHVSIDYCLPTTEIAAKLIELINEQRFFTDKHE